MVEWCGKLLWGVGMRWWTGVVSCCGDKVVDWCGKPLWDVEMRQSTGVVSCYRVRG